jgi:tetratricopeptide (TPR) repeat protein
MLCASLACIAPAQAGSACPGNAGEPLPPAAEMAALAGHLAGYEQACGRDAGFLAYRGAVLIQLGQMEAAAALLEQALLIAPELAGAQADYARALAAMGDTRAARSLVDNLLSRNDVPGGLRAQLQDWQGFIGHDQGTSAWQTGGSLTLRLGGETNLNSAPTIGSLDLTLPDGPVTLPLAKSNRAQGGGAALAEASLQAGRNLANGGRLQLLGDIRSRYAPGMDETDYQQYEALAVLTLPVAGANGAAPLAANQFSLGASRLDYGGAQLYEAQRLGVARILQTGACLTGVSLDLENRHFPTAANLDGRFAGLGGSLRCPLAGARVSLLGRLGQDRAVETSRPGGDQQRWDLRATYSRRLAGGMLDAEISLGHQSDDSAYSELLEGGAKRRLTRLGFRAEWAVPLRKGLEGLVSFEASRQDSNIPLFDISNAALWLGGRWSWGN